MTVDRPWPLLAPFLHLVLMLSLISLNWLVFRHLMHQNYFLWYLKNGALISLATGFLALTWKDMKARIGLISSHPSAYVGACFQILGVFVFSLAPTKSGEKTEPKDLPFDIGLNFKFFEVLDNVLYILLALVMLLLCLAWLVIVAPLGYFVTVIAGVPARQELRGKIAPTYVHEETGDTFRGDKGNVTILEPATATTLPSDSTYLSFARDPFAVTQAMTALVLWNASIIYSRVS